MPTVETKICTKCKVALPLDSFGWANGPDSYLRGDCKGCSYAKRIAFKNDNEEHWAAQKRTIQLKHKYGLTLEEWDQMFLSQNGKCAICEIPLSSRVSVDHDHTCCPGYKTCGRCIRGLLCSNCNIGLGNLKENVNSLRRAIEYLERTAH